ncbi:tetratricopeptide repeat protein [Singulisphaera sp. PoT]|uniref:tetratricopeptide repeat protein n=1 Tax=Singulisphaera sp. PoT TaxID=3411797 RepID=UPI003BF4877D
MLDRWTAADQDDSHAQVARLKRMASMPRSGDPDRAGQIEILASLLEREPKNLVTREALISALAEAGEPDRGRQLLEAWPAESRDSALYARLRGRWDLDFDRNPEHALAEFDRVLTTTPHDWKTHYRRARALQKLGRVPEARQAAETMSRLRERLDPAVLGPRLGSDLARLTDPKALADLAELCSQANLGRLAEAWRKEAAAPPSEPQSENANAARGVLDLPLAPSGAPRPR